MAHIQEHERRFDHEGSVLEHLRWNNSPEFDRLHGEYIRLAPVGEGENLIGADMVAAWYGRNLKMFAHIARLAKRTDDRIFVLVGAGHGALLKEFVRHHPTLDLVDAMPYLA